MSEDDKTELKQIIQTRIDYLLVMIDENAKSGTALPSNQVPDNMFEPGLMASDSAGIEDHAIIQAKQELTQLTRALSWVESRNAGICENCGCDIPIERLKNIPTTRTCAKCA